MMRSYMPQDLFDLIVATAVRNDVNGGDALDEAVPKLATIYRNSQLYFDDGFENDIKLAATELLKILYEGPSGWNPFALREITAQLVYCCKEYRPDGKRKPFFRAAIFNRQKTPLPNRVKQSLQDMTSFVMGTATGTFPLRPVGWDF